MLVPWDIGVKIGKERGERRLSCMPAVAFKGRPGLDPRVGEGVNPVLSSLTITTCGKSVFSERNPNTPGGLLPLKTLNTVDNQ